MGWERGGARENEKWGADKREREGTYGNERNSYAAIQNLISWDSNAVSQKNLISGNYN